MTSPKTLHSAPVQNKILKVNTLALFFVPRGKNSSWTCSRHEGYRLNLGNLSTEAYHTVDVTRLGLAWGCFYLWFINDVLFTFWRSHKYIRFFDALWGCAHGIHLIFKMNGEIGEGIEWRSLVWLRVEGCFAINPKNILFL